MPYIPTREQKLELARTYGERFGWKLSQTSFNVECLAESGIWRRGVEPPKFGPSGFGYFDHPYYYRKDRRAVAIVCHLYKVPADLFEQAEAHGLRAYIERDYLSWHYPGESTMIVYVAAAPRQVLKDRSKALTTPAGIIRAARERGLELVAEDDHVALYGDANALTPELHAAIGLRAAEIREHLTQCQN